MGQLHRRCALYAIDDSTPADATVPCHTQPLDVLDAPVTSFQVTLTGAIGSISLGLALEGSNDFPPNGAIMGVQPANRGGWAASSGWQPAESSWVEMSTATLGAAVPLVDNGTTVLLPNGGFFACRWARVRTTPAAGWTGGNLVIDAVARGTG